MPRCLTYVRSRIYKQAWSRCTRRAPAGPQFCRSHESAVNGAILGLWVSGFPERAGAPVRASQKDNKKLAGKI